MKKGVFAVALIALMCVIGGSSIVAFFKLHLSDLNPDKEEMIADPTVGVANSPQSSVGLLKTVERAISSVDSYTKTVTPLSITFSGISGWINEATQKDIFLNGESTLLRLSNGYYTPPFPYSHPEDSWNSLLDFDTWLKARDIKFFHLILADKGDDSFGTLPQGAPDGYARMAGEYKTFLKENGIDYLDAKPKLLAQNSDFYHWFYKTDHRINVQTGLLLAEESAKKLDSLGIQVETEAVRKDNFTRVVFPNSFLGSLGRNLGPGKMEDLELYYPMAETRFRVQTQDNGTVSYGSFENALLKKEYLSAGNASLYAFRGAEPLVNIINENSHNVTRVLVIGLCKINVICPYLALSVRYLDMMAPGPYNGNVRSYIEQTNPDAVILCIDVPWEGGEGSFELK